MVVFFLMSCGSPIAPVLPTASPIPPTFTSTLTETIIPTLTFTPTETFTPTQVPTPTPIPRQLKYYLTVGVRNVADFLTIHSLGINTIVLDLDASNPSTWDKYLSAAQNNDLNIVIFPSDSPHPRRVCDLPYTDSANGNIDRVKRLLDVATKYPNFIGIFNAHMPLWSLDKSSSACPMTFNEMAGLKDKLKAYALSKGRDIKVWNYIDSLYDGTMFPYDNTMLPNEEISKIMDVAVVWKYCAGNSEGLCIPFGEGVHNVDNDNSALSLILHDRNRINSNGLDGKVELVFINQTFTAGAGYGNMFSPMDLNTYSCDFLKTNALDGFGYYTWDENWPKTQLKDYPDLQSEVLNIWNNCVSK